MGSVHHLVRPDKERNITDEQHIWYSSNWNGWGAQFKCNVQLITCSSQGQSAPILIHYIKPSSPCQHDLNTFWFPLGPNPHPHAFSLQVHQFDVRIWSQVSSPLLHGHQSVQVEKKKSRVCHSLEDGGCGVSFLVSTAPNQVMSEAGHQKLSALSWLLLTAPFPTTSFSQPGKSAVLKTKLILRGGRI